MTDQELIEGILRHDRNALQYLVNTYQKRVIKTAQHFVEEITEAEDLSQEIFMEVIDSIGKFKARSSISTWIYRITVNKSLNAVKKKKRSAMFARLESIFVPGNKARNNFQNEPFALNNALEENEKRQLLYRTIGSLPENQRIAFNLHKFDDLSYKEIADIMQLSLSSVESLIHRAKLNLQKKLVTHFSEYAKK